MYIYIDPYIHRVDLLLCDSIDATLCVIWQAYGRTSVADHRADPSALRFLIGHDLKVARERANLKQTEAAKVLGCSQAKINYLETGKTQQKPDEVTALLRAYGADVEHVDRMASLAARAEPLTGTLKVIMGTFRLNDR